MDKIIKKLEEIAREEMRRGVMERGAFNSRHEGYAVMEEEFEEFEEEYDRIVLKKAELWKCIKKDDANITPQLVSLSKVALRCGAELMQFVAMAMKMTAYENYNKKPE